MSAENINFTGNDKFLEFIVEIWRLPKLFKKLIAKQDYSEQQKYVSQFNWFNKKALDFLQSEGLSFPEYEDMPFDVGMPLTPINIGDFSSEDELVIEQILEPVIMKGDKIIKAGTAILKKAEK
ncbi:MAG TPA: hypothetical protein PKJ33_00640 [Alphaproteobacteria bacterium]|nr:hypothetical protein [Alphaproteobacteria bacterium]